MVSLSLDDELVLNVVSRSFVESFAERLRKGDWSSGLAFGCDEVVVVAGGVVAGGGVLVLTVRLGG